MRYFGVMENNVEKRWISKSALTKGVRCAYLSPSSFDPRYLAECREDGTRPSANGFYEKAGRYDFATREEALAHAEALRAKKIASLERQLKKVRELKIKVES